MAARRDKGSRLVSIIHAVAHERGIQLHAQAEPEALLSRLDDEALREVDRRLNGPRRGRKPTRDKLVRRLLADADQAVAAADPSAERDKPPAGKRASPKKQAKKRSTKQAPNGATLGFEDKMWAAADKLRGSMDAADYKHVVLGLIFLKYISDAFEAKHAALEGEKHADPEEPDEYLADNIFWVPRDARWSHIRRQAKLPTIGKTIDEAMAAIEADNPGLKGVLLKEYARPALSKTMLGELIDLIGTIGFGDDRARSKDILGRVYEYFLGKFANAEGKGGGEFYTPHSVVNVLVEMLEPFRGRVYDPCCGSGGMFVQSERFVLAHGGRIGDIAIYGQEMNHTTWRLAKMNMAVRGIDADIRWNAEGSFHANELKDLRADYILANPPFNVSDWGGERLRDDVRWRGFKAPPVGNANYAWLLHILHHLSPTGTAGVVLANGSMSSTQSGEGDIRQKMLEKDVVDCMVALPGQLFYSTQIPACLWFLARSKAPNGFRDRRGEVLFIDARKLGYMVDRTRREFSDADIARIADTYHAWRGEPEADPYADVAGFCKSAMLDEIGQHGFVLTPGRYVDSEALEDDGVPFEERFAELKAKLEKQFEEGAELEAVIKSRLAGIGVDG